LPEPTSRRGAVSGESSQDGPGEPLDGTSLKAAYEQLARSFDEEHGGFGKAPKFPAPHNLLFLLREASPSVS